MKKLLNKSFLPLLFVGMLLSFAAHSADEVSEKPIRAVNLDTVGILTNSNGGIDFKTWQKSNPDFVYTSLFSMPESLKYPSLENVRNNVLLSSTLPPKSSNYSYFATRITILARLGEVDSIDQLLSKAPADFISENDRIIAVAAGFIAENYEKSCADINNPKLANNILARKFNVVCQHINGKKNEAELAEKLMKEDGIIIEKDLMSAASMFASNKEKADKALKEYLLTNQLVLQKIETTFPDIEKLTRFEITKKSFEKVDFTKLSDQEKVALASQLFLLLDASEMIDVSTEIEQLFLFTISHHLNTPTALLHRVIGKFLQEERPGDVVLAVLSFAGNNVLTVDDKIIVTKALNKVGFMSHARIFAIEAMNQNE